MALKLSVAMRTALLGSSSFKNIFDGGFLDLYSGTMPATADTSESGTKLVGITVDGGATGLSYGTAAAGVILKNSDVWEGEGLVTGEAGYYVFYDSNHETGASPTYPRFMGTIGLSNADLIMSDLTVTLGLTTSIETWSIGLPTG